MDRLRYHKPMDFDKKGRKGGLEEGRRISKTNMSQSNHDVHPQLRDQPGVLMVASFRDSEKIGCGKALSR